MINSTQVLYFTLGAYIDYGVLKYLFFLAVLFMYVLILCANVLLIVVICLNRSLHEPMYIFLCSLFVNELYGSAGLFPFLLVQLLSDTHTVSVPYCFLQIFCIYTYVCVELYNLAIMSYDRYLAICHPLQYNTRMTSQRIAVLIVFAWFYASLLNIIPISLSATRQLCGGVINKVYCDNYSIVKLSCGDITVNNIYGLIGTCHTFFYPLVFIFYTYMRILRVCFSGSKQTRQKAVSTCTPHMATLLNFACGALFEVLQSRFKMNTVPNLLRILLSLYFLTFQPLFSPVVYGLNIKNIRVVCKNLLFT